MYPVALEAVLRAKVALLANFLAVWTLQLARVVIAVVACAFARGGGVSSHDVCLQSVECEVSKILRKDKSRVRMTWSSFKWDFVGAGALFPVPSKGCGDGFKKSNAESWERNCGVKWG